MLNIDEAQRLVLSTATVLRPAPSPSGQSLGQVLAEDVASDMDMPPFDKSLVDGFAVRSADLVGGCGKLAIAGEVVAGDAPWGPDRTVASGTAVRIMTGAAIPSGADAVVMVERTQVESAAGAVQGSDRAVWSQARDGGSVAIRDDRFKPGQNIMRQGSEMTSGQVVLRAGTRLRAAEIGLLAAVGFGTAPVFPRADVSIISTGNEIVEADVRPGPGQIRNSNGSTLAAMVTEAGGAARYLGIARDTASDLERLVRAGLESDILLLSGGVSAGELDLVPDVLKGLGAREIFHKVSLKPGKPIWFGARERPAPGDGSSDRGSRQTLIFGLPGNPVSVVVCFELFVKPAMRRLMGFAEPLPRHVSAALAEDRSWRSDRPTYCPASLEAGDNGWQVRLVQWKGSPDLLALADSNGFAILPEGDHQKRRGEHVRVLRTEF
jgi:molybdopterin molybdotransferase